MEHSLKRQRVEAENSLTLQHHDMTTNPFLLFPEEVWLLIIDNVQGNLTLSNLITAIPEFYSLLYPNVSKFEFSRVATGEFKYQPTAGHPQVSLIVDKDWCDFVFSFVNQKSCEWTGERLGSHSSFQYFSNPSVGIPQRFSSTKEVRSFYETWKQNLTVKMPLPPLMFSLESGGDYFGTLNYLKAWNTLSLELGSAMHTLVLEFNWTMNSNDVLKVIKLLNHTPKLSTLAIDFQSKDVTWVEEITDFPPLAKLHTLEIRSKKEHQNALLKLFLNGGYFRTGRIKELKLSEFENKFYYGVVFKLNAKFNGESLQNFRKFLKIQLRKTVYIKPINSQLCKLFDLMSKGNKTAREVVISKGAFFTESKKTMKSKIKYIKFYDSSFPEFQFLSAFPALEHLHVVRTLRTKSWCFIEKIKEEEPITWLLCNYLYKNNVPEELNIWQTFPSLKSLIVENEGVFVKHFFPHTQNKPVVFRNSNQT